MYYTCSYIAVRGVDTPFTNKCKSEPASSSLESFVCQKAVECCKGLADKCQNLLADTSCIGYFGQQLVGGAIYLLLHIHDIEDKVSATLKVEAAMT